jgi:hypothetical protein
MDDTVLFTDFGIVVFVIIASAIALMLSVLALATTRSIRHSGLSDIQDTIGQRLRERYAPERSTPTRLANLLREFEQRSLSPKHLPETTMRARLTLSKP